MAAGGNLRARQFFKQHGWDDIGADKIESKYTSRAAQLYRSLLEKEAQKVVPANLLLATEKEASRGFGGAGAGDLLDFKHVEPEARAAQPQAEAASAAPAAETPKPAVPKPVAPAAIKPRSAVGAAKKTGGKLGLVKKLDTKTDDAIYSQAPAPEPVKPAPGEVAPGATSAAPTTAASRFAYDTLTAEPAPMQRGKDGHLTIGNNDFFAAAARPANRSGGGAAPKPAEPTREVHDETLKKYSNAKAISSRDFQQGNGESETERQTRLAKFQGAAAISSADYFGRSEGAGAPSGMSGSDDMDVSAADIVNRLSIQAKQDIQQVKQMAAAATKKLSGMASKFIGDLNRMNG